MLYKISWMDVFTGRRCEGLWDHLTPNTLCSEDEHAMHGGDVAIFEKMKSQGLLEWECEGDVYTILKD